MVDSIVMQSGRYKAYPEYKDSGFEWLGEIPSSWNTIPVGRLYHRNKRTGFSEKELLSVYRDYGVIPKSSRDDNNNKPSEDLSPYQLVKPDDLVMNKMKAWQGSIAISEYEGIVSPAYFVYEPERKMFEVALPRYIHYLLRNPMYITQYMSRSKGIRVNQWDLDPDEFQKIELLLPSKAEQSKIFEFLDYETAKIDTLIQKQQRLIELLTEKRQAVISHAVTKGLNPDVPMKDSGVEWLGEVPEHWEVWKLSHAFRSIGSGTTPSTNDESAFNGNIPWVTTGELRENIITDTLKKVSKQTMEKYSALKIHPSGSVIIAMYGATIGRVAILGVDATTNQACCVLSDSKFIFNKFLFYWLFAYRDEIIQLSSGGGQPNINQEKVSSLKVSAPEVSEQLEIVNYLDDLTLKVDTLIEKSNQQIHLMQERRTALISAAVTGKIDVRDWVKPE